MKVFKVYVKNWDWDQYDSCIVVAESEEDVRSMLENDSHWITNRVVVKTPTPTKHTVTCYFESNQGKIFIEEVDLNTKDVICSSFNAG